MNYYQLRLHNRSQTDFTVHNVNLANVLRGCRAGDSTFDGLSIDGLKDCHFGRGGLCRGDGHTTAVADETSLSRTSEVCLTSGSLQSADGGLGRHTDLGQDNDRCSCTVEGDDNSCVAVANTSGFAHHSVRQSARAISCASPTEDLLHDVEGQVDARCSESTLALGGR